MWALVIGFTTGLGCYSAVLLKERLGYDDSLDAFGVHGVGGFLGAILTGVFASSQVNIASTNGLIFGNIRPVIIQLLGLVVVGIYASGMTWVLLKGIDKVMGLRVPTSDEREGLDSSEHGETGYAN